MGHVQDNAEESVRRVIDVLTDGHFTYPLDDGSVIQLRSRLTNLPAAPGLILLALHPSWLVISMPQLLCARQPCCMSSTLVNDDIPLNAGCLKPLNHHPGRLFAESALPSCCGCGKCGDFAGITDALYGALG